MANDKEDTQDVEEIELRAVEQRDDDIKDAEFVETEVEQPVRMTREQMIAKGLLPGPPTVKKKTLDKAISEQVANMQAIPAERIERQQPIHAARIDNEELVKKASARGGMALELIKAILANTGASFENVDELVKYAFEIADGIQAETDRGYNKSLVNAAAG